MPWVAVTFPSASRRWSASLARSFPPWWRPAPAAGRCCAYGGPSSEIALRKAGLLWGGRLNPLKARVLLETCLRAGLDRAAIAEVFETFG